jgi:hypothetical protein
MLALNVRTPIVAGFVPRKKDYAAGLFCVAFKHTQRVYISSAKQNNRVSPASAFHEKAG